MLGRSMPRLERLTEARTAIRTTQVVALSASTALLTVRSK